MQQTFTRQPFLEKLYLLNIQFANPIYQHFYYPIQKSIKKRGGFADETVVYTLAVIVGAFAVVILVIVFVLAFVVTVMRKKLNRYVIIFDKLNIKGTEAEPREKQKLLKQWTLLLGV